MKESHKELLTIAVAATIFVLVCCLNTFICAAIVYWVWNTICPLVGGVSPINAVQSVAVVIAIRILRSIFRQRSPE